MTRPWRLTRRQRVEMEAALMRLRRDVADSRGGQFIAAAHWIMQAATHVGFRTWEHDYGSQRTLRARVAIALRAALRADEEARVEQVERRASRVPSWCGADYRTGAMEWAGELREWSEMERPAGRVPLALWEVVR